MLCIHSDISN
jgi:hypothetical protein